LLGAFFLAAGFLLISLRITVRPTALKSYCPANPALMTLQFQFCSGGHRLGFDDGAIVLIPVWEERRAPGIAPGGDESDSPLPHPIRSVQPRSSGARGEWHGLPPRAVNAACLNARMRMRASLKYAGLARDSGLGRTNKPSNSRFSGAIGAALPAIMRAPTHTHAKEPRHGVGAPPGGSRRATHHPGQGAVEEERRLMRRSSQRTTDVSSAALPDS
jgi:hypothetical protein